MGDIFHEYAGDTRRFLHSFPPLCTLDYNDIISAISACISKRRSEACSFCLVIGRRRVVSFKKKAEYCHTYNQKKSKLSFPLPSRSRVLFFSSIAQRRRRRRRRRYGFCPLMTTPTGQWSDPPTSPRMNASCTSPASPLVRSLDTITRGQCRPLTPFGPLVHS